MNENGRGENTRMPARDALIRAGLHLFVSQGYHATTTSQITKEAGVAKGTLYVHFKSKQDLALEIFRTYAGEAASGVAHKLCSANSMTERIRVLVSHMFTWCEEHAEEATYLFLLRHSETFGTDPVTMDRIHPGQLVGEVISQGQMAGEIAEGALPVLRNVWGVPYAFIRDRLEGWSSTDLRQSVDAATRMCCRALGAGEPAPPRVEQSLDSSHNSI